MKELTNINALSKAESFVFHVIKDIVERTVAICRCKADGTIITNHSPIEDKQFLKLKIEEAIHKVGSFPHNGFTFTKAKLEIKFAPTQHS